MSKENNQRKLLKEKLRDIKREHKKKKKEWSDLSVEEKVGSLAQEMDGVGKTLGIFERAIKELFERIEKLEAK